MRALLVVAGLLAGHAAATACPLDRGRLGWDNVGVHGRLPPHPSLWLDLDVDRWPTFVDGFDRPILASMQLVLGTSLVRVDLAIESGFVRVQQRETLDRRYVIDPWVVPATRRVRFNNSLIDLYSDAKLVAIEGPGQSRETRLLVQGNIFIPENTAVERVVVTYADRREEVLVLVDPPRWPSIVVWTLTIICAVFTLAGIGYSRGRS